MEKKIRFVLIISFEQHSNVMWYNISGIYDAITSNICLGETQSMNFYSLKNVQKRSTFFWPCYFSSVFFFFF